MMLLKRLGRSSPLLSSTHLKVVGRQIGNQPSNPKISATTVVVDGAASTTNAMTSLVYETGTGPTPITAGPATGSSVSTSVNQPPAATSQSSQDLHRLSNTTVHLLIAAACIGATLVVGCIVCILYRMRQGRSFVDVFRSSSSRKPHRPYVSRPVASNVENPNEYPRDVKALLQGELSSSSNPPQYPSRPQSAVVRWSSASSNLPLMSAAHGPSKEDRAAFLIDETRPPSPEPLAPTGQSGAPTPALPVERSTRQFSEEAASGHASMPPYLRNIASTSQPAVSRFSWTNSQVPKSPVDTRISMRTSRSSIPRYRTVESWVGAQAGQLDNVRVQEHLQREIGAHVQALEPVVEGTLSVDRCKRTRTGFSKTKRVSPPGVGQPSTGRAHAPVTAVTIEKRKPKPIQVSAPRKRFYQETVPEHAEPPLPPTPRSPTQRGKPRRQARHRPQGSDATVFRVHPGTEVVLEPGSRIPSSILDEKVMPSGAL